MFHCSIKYKLALCCGTGQNSFHTTDRQRVRCIKHAWSPNEAGPGVKLQTNALPLTSTTHITLSAPTRSYHHSMNTAHASYISSTPSNRPFTPSCRRPYQVENVCEVCPPPSTNYTPPAALNHISRLNLALHLLHNSYICAYFNPTGIDINIILAAK